MYYEHRELANLAQNTFETLPQCHWSYTPLPARAEAAPSLEAVYRVSLRSESTDEPLHWLEIEIHRSEAGYQYRLCVFNHSVGLLALLSDLLFHLHELSCNETLITSLLDACADLDERLRMLGLTYRSIV